MEPTARFERATSRLQGDRTAIVLRWRDAPGRLKPLSVKSGKPLPGDWQTHCHDCRFFLLGTAGEVWLSPMESLVPRLADYASNCHDRCLLPRRSRCPLPPGTDSCRCSFNRAPHSANVRTGFSDPCTTGSSRFFVAAWHIQRSASRASVVGMPAPSRFSPHSRIVSQGRIYLNLWQSHTVYAQQSLPSDHARGSFNG